MILKQFNNGAVLLENLKIIQPFLDDDRNTEIIINRPGELITESDKWTFHALSELTLERCMDIATLIASYSRQRLDSGDPILSATLPKGERVQVVIPPATLPGRVSITIRRPSDHKFTLEEWDKQGAFSQCKNFTDQKTPEEVELVKLLSHNEYLEFLKLAVQTRKNIIVSGSTGSGKTTFMKTLLQLVPQKSERVLSIENVDELKLYESHANSVPLFYSATKKGEAKELTQQQLLESGLRMRPDRMFVAELIRGDEAFYYLRNVNSGHPGSITSIHANSARLAIEQLVLFLKESKSGTSLTREDTKQLLFMCVDIIIQIKKVNGKRIITEIYYDPDHKRKMAA